MVPASRSSTESSQWLSQQVNKCSEVKYGVFRVEVKVWKEQTAECTGVSARAVGLLNGGAGFEPMTSTAGKRRCITNVAGDLPLYHHSPHVTHVTGPSLLGRNKHFKFFP